MYCVKSGREADELYEHLCPECFVSSRTFVQFPSDVIIQSCRSCGRFEILGEWKNSDVGEALEAAVMKNIFIENGVRLLDYSLDVRQESDIHYAVTARLRLRIAGLEIEKEGKMRVRHRETTCPTCQKIRSNYYEAIIQVRPASGKKLRENELEDISREIRKRVDAGFSANPGVFITKEEDMHGGRDFYMGNRSYAHRIARALVKSYGATYTESSSLWGMKDGKEIYRTTYLVRLPPYRAGDFIEIDGKLYLLASFGSERLKCIDLETWGEFPFDRNERLKVLGGKEVVQRAVVVSESSAEVQLMDPQNYRTVDVRKPEGFTASEDAPVIRYEERLYLVPHLHEKGGL